MGIAVGAVSIVVIIIVTIVIVVVIRFHLRKSNCELHTSLSSQSSNSYIMV